MEIVLASASPRRKKLMEETGIKFKVISPNIDETVNEKTTPQNYAKCLAERKAAAVLPMVSDSIIIAADTIVVYRKKIIGKPKDKKDATRILNMLSGKKHFVYTGVCVINTKTNQKFVGYEKSAVTFNILSEKKINGYLRTSNYLDKAGGYNAEDSSSKIFIKSIEGSKTNVVGLPMELLFSYLNRLGIKNKQRQHQ